MLKAYAGLVVLGVIWGSNFMFMKWATVYISPAQTVLLRVLFGFLPLAVFAWHSKVITRTQLRHLPHFMVMSVLATSFYYYGFVAGTAVLPSGIAGLLSGSIPIFTFLGTLLFLPEERPSRRMACGVALCFVGIVLAARPWQGSDGVSGIGVVWMLSGSMSVGASFVYARRYLSPLQLPPLALATWQTFLAVVTLALLVSFEGIGAIADDSKALWGTVLGLGLLGTGAAYILYYFTIDKLGSVRAAGATYIAPIIAVVIAAFIGEEITILEIVALVLITAGVVMIQLSKKKQAAITPTKKEATKKEAKVAL